MANAPGLLVGDELDAGRGEADDLRQQRVALLEQGRVQSPGGHSTLDRAPLAASGLTAEPGGGDGTTAAGADEAARALAGDGVQCRAQALELSVVRHERSPFY